jgi:cyclopropane-fatty-acyl-phospholipid synthase
MSAALLEQIEQRLHALHVPLEVELWNGESVRVGGAPQVKLILRAPRALAALARPTLGRLAESYVRNQIDFEGAIDEVIAIGELICGGRRQIESMPRRRAWNWRRAARPNDRESIRHHYDVSNDFYSLWLDRARVYSCAYFKRDDDTLDTAQEQKLDHICRKLRLAPGERFLDIGCGWGALLFHAAERYGSEVVGITLSENQFEHVEREIAVRGLRGRVAVRLEHYRDLPEDRPFDKIASVGMFEHVGLRNLPAYFGKIRRLLRPGGMVLNHGITAAWPQDADGPGSDVSDFMERYVFPGSQLVHLARVLEAMTSCGLESSDIECLRPHYARTLRHWVRRLEARREEAQRLVGEERYRTWRIYMAGCARAFDLGWISVHQILAGKPREDGLLPLPLTREYIYG